MKKLIITLSLTAMALAADAQSSTKITISPAATFQTLRSFGASDCWTADYVGRYFIDGEKEKAARWLFSQETDAEGNPLGIALSQWRINLGAGSASQGDASNIKDKTRRTECLLNADGKTYDWTRAQGQQWFMQKAKSYGVPDFLLFSNAPLIYFTKNRLANNKDNKYSGSILKADSYADFAAYLTECAFHFAKAGYNIGYISPVNEPAFSWTDGQEGSPWTNTEIAQLAKEIDKQLTVKDLTTKILLPEASAWNRLYEQCNDYGGRASNQIDAFWNSHNTNTYIGGLTHLAPVVAGHSYWTFRTNDELENVRTKVKEAASKYNVETAQTEWCMLGKEPETATGFPASYDDASYMDIALYMAKVIYADLTFANVSSWSYWTAMAQEKWSQKDRFYLLRLNTPDDSGNESYGDIQTGGTVSDSKNLWVLGNYSRFVRPGYRRIAMNVPNGGLNGLMGTAFISPDNTTVVAVLVNYGYLRRNVSFSIDGFTTLSIDTYTTDADNNLKHSAVSQDEKLSLAKSSVTTVVMKVSTSTGIDHITTESPNVNHSVYDLSGHHVDGALLRHGVYIINGKKTAVSNMK